MRFQYLLCLSFLAAAVTPALSLPVPPYYTVKLPGQRGSVNVRPGQRRSVQVMPGQATTTPQGLMPPPRVKLFRTWSTRRKNLGRSPSLKRTPAEAKKRKDLVRTEAQKNNKPLIPKGPKPPNYKEHTKQRAAHAVHTLRNKGLESDRINFRVAAGHHKDTVGLPGRRVMFDAFGIPYSGKQVRGASFNSHLPGNKV